MKIMAYQLMWFLNVTNLQLAQIEKLSNKFPNYHMVDYDPLKEQIQQIDENYLFSMPTWLIVLITVLGTLLTTLSIATYWYCKYIRTKNKPKAFSVVLHKNVMKNNQRVKLCVQLLATIYSPS